MNWRLDSESILDLKTSLSKASLEDNLDSFEEFKKSSMALDGKQAHASIFFCICVELEMLDKRLDDIQVFFKDPLSVSSSVKLLEYHERLQNEYWMSDGGRPFWLFNKKRFIADYDDLFLYKDQTVSLNILSENFEDVVPEEAKCPDTMTLPVFIKLLEDNKSGIYNRKNMLKINEKAFELLSLLRGEIFTYSHFVMKSYGAIKTLEQNKILNPVKFDESSNAPDQKSFVKQTYKDLDYTGNSIINFSTTLTAGDNLSRSKQLAEDLRDLSSHGIISLHEKDIKRDPQRLWRKAIECNILACNYIRDYRISFNFSHSQNVHANTTNIDVVDKTVVQNLLKFDSQKMTIYSQGVNEKGLISQNQIIQARESKEARELLVHKPPSNYSYDNQSIISEDQQSQSQSDSVEKGGKRKYKYQEEEDIDTKIIDVSAIELKYNAKDNHPKYVDESRMDLSFEDLLKADFNNNNRKYKQYQEKHGNTTLFNITSNSVLKDGNTGQGFGTGSNSYKDSHSHSTKNYDRDSRHSQYQNRDMPLLDDMVDFQSINLNNNNNNNNKNMRKKRDTSPSRKIIIAKNKPDEEVHPTSSNSNHANHGNQNQNTNTNNFTNRLSRNESKPQLKPYTSGKSGMLFTVTKSKLSMNDNDSKDTNRDRDTRDSHRGDKPKIIKYNLNNNKKLKDQLKGELKAELRKTGMTKSISNTGSNILQSPHSISSTKDLMQEISSNSLQRVVSGRDGLSTREREKESRDSNNSNNINRDSNYNTTQPNGFKLFKKTFSKQEEKFQAISEGLIERINRESGPINNRTMKKDSRESNKLRPSQSVESKGFYSAKKKTAPVQLTSPVEQNSNLQSTMQPANNTLTRTKTEGIFKLKPSNTKLPEIGILSNRANSRDNKLRREGMGSVFKPLGSTNNRDKN